MQPFFQSRAQELRHQPAVLRRAEACADELDDGAVALPGEGVELLEEEEEGGFVVVEVFGEYAFDGDVEVSPCSFVDD